MKRRRFKFRVTSLTINSHRLTYYLSCRFLIMTLRVRLKFRVTSLTINSHRVGEGENRHLSLFSINARAVMKPDNVMNILRSESVRAQTHAKCNVLNTTCIFLAAEACELNPTLDTTR